MPIPAGTTPHLGPVIDTSGELLAPSPALRDAGAISFREGRPRKVNAAGNAWVDVVDFTTITGTVTDGQIPASIMRDAEFTAATVRGLLGLTADEINDLLTGATLVGQVLTFTQNDGTTVPVTIPTATPGAGDGVVQSGVFNADQTELILTLDTGGVVTIDVPAALRQAGSTVDQTARDNAIAAQASADANQAGILAHGNSTHNQDQIARDGVDTAQQAANAAASEASDANAAAATAQQTADAAETAAATANERSILNETEHEADIGKSVDVRLTGFPTPSADTLGIHYDDGTHLKFGIDEDIHTVEPMGTFSPVAVASPYLGEFPSRGCS